MQGRDDVFDTAVPLALAALYRLIRQQFTPDAWSLVGQQVDFLLDNLPVDPDSMKLLAYWVNQYSHGGQDFAQTAHHYVDPSLEELGCVVVLQFVACDKQSIRTRILEVLERPDLDHIIVASVFANSALEEDLTKEFEGFLPERLTFLSLCRSSASDLVDLNSRIFEHFCLALPSQRLVRLPRHILSRIEK